MEFIGSTVSVDRGRKRKWMHGKAPIWGERQVCLVVDLVNRAGRLEHAGFHKDGSCSRDVSIRDDTSALDG